MRSWIILLIVLASKQIGAQSDLRSELTIDQYFDIIIENHPVARQAKLLSDVAKQEIRMAKGAFDPKLEAILASKQFQDKSYYSMLDGYLTVPTRSPITPKIGFEQNKGELLNDVDKIPGDRQFLAGVYLPLGKGLITDERRTTLKQAELLTSIAEADQVKIINKLLLSAAKEYWSWYYYYEAYQLLDRASLLTEDIFKRVKISYELGEASVLDTIQSRITWQSRLIERQEAYLEFQNSLIRVSNYLWDDNASPVSIESPTRPVAPGNLVNFTIADVEALLQAASENHPELNKQQLKIQQYEFEKRLAQEYLKPKLDLSYMLLSQPGTVHAFDPVHDYKLGVDFSFPIFLRKERSKIALTDLKIRNTTLDFNQQQREIVNETKTAINETNTTSMLITQMQSMVDSYDKLMQGELLNLENGESDLFKINIQQEKLINAQLKLVKLKTEFAKQKFYVLWAAGVKNLEL